MTIYLDARSVDAFDSLKILAAFHLLEHLAKRARRYLNEDNIAATVGVTRSEGKAIKDFRNDVVHDNLSVGRSVSRLLRALDMSGSAMLRDMQRIDVGDAELDAATYLILLVDRALLRWVGYDGLAQHYLPTTEEALRRCSPPS